MQSLNQIAMNVLYAFFAISENVLITSILHQLSIPHLQIPEKQNKPKTQNVRENYEVIVISINKIWTWTIEIGLRLVSHVLDSSLTVQAIFHL